MSYKRSKDECKTLPNLILGREVETPIGIGLLVSAKMPTNGLYVSPEQATYIVWFSTEQSKGGFVQKEFSADELYPVVNSRVMHMREQACNIRELTRGFTTQPTNEAMVSCL